VLEDFKFNNFFYFFGTALFIYEGNPVMIELLNQTNDKNSMFIKTVYKSFFSYLIILILFASITYTSFG